VLVIFLLTLGAAATITANATPLYGSTARLFVGTSLSTNVNVYAAALFSAQRATSYADLASDPVVLQKVIDKLDLGVSTSQLAPHVTIKAVKDSVILEVTATAIDPFVAQSIAQAEAEEVQSLIIKLETPTGKGAQSPITASLPGKASYNASPISPLVALNLVVGALLGLLLGVSMALLRELSDTSIRTTEEVQDITGSPVLAQVPFDQSVGRTPLIDQKSSQTERAEAFRILRTNFQFVDLDGKSQVIVVTSALPNEGKTNTATNLAVTMAQAGKSVLLVDCDFRKPQVFELLGLENVVGVLNLLVGSGSLEEFVQRHQSGIDFLGTGPRPPNPAEVLGTQVMRDFLTAIRVQYDAVIIDAPPLLPIADPAILASEVDGVLMVARYGKTTRDQLRAATERIDSVDGHILGTVLNMTPRHRTSPYGYGYEYGYGQTTDDGKGNRKKDRQPRGNRAEGAKRFGRVSAKR